MSTNELDIDDYSGKVLTDDLITQHVQKLRKLILEYRNLDITIITLQDLLKALQIVEDNDLKKFRSDDGYILRFLHCTDFNIPPALKRMQDYCKLFLEHPEWFASCSPSGKKERIEDYDKVVFKERDRQGRAIYVVKLGKMNTANSSPQEQAQLFEMWLEFIMEDPTTQAKGVSVILDMLDYSWKLFQWLTPTNIKVSTKKIDLYPCKEFIFHIVNTSFLVNASIKLVWPFLSDRLKKMIKFHFEDWPSLHEYVNPEVLPAEYGGTGADINFEKSIKWLFEYDSAIGQRLKYQRIS